MCSSRRSSASFASEEMASSRMSFSSRDSMGITASMTLWSPRRPSARTTTGSDCGGVVPSISMSRGTARLLPISASASTARSLTHQSLSLVASMRCPTARSSLVWLRISTAARRMSSSWSPTSCSTASTTFGPADLAERIRGAAAHPPVVVGNRFEKLLDRLGVADFVEHFHRGAARVFVFVLEHRDQVLDGLRIVGADDDVDGLVLHVDFRVAQQHAHLFDLDRAVHLGERAQRGGTHQLVGVLELLLQRALDLGLREARQDVDDVQARDRVFAVQAADQLRQVVVGGELAEDAEQAPPFRWLPACRRRPGFRAPKGASDAR